ncbi:MAG TPA: SCP2 sterol-binding domain-containing protein [Gemmatimonadales bacterium]|nr:SCP2 sterol-binding domain-containing protein [Gemmatimonadales bacterium]
MTHPPLIAFTDAWAAAWAEQLNASEAYRVAAATWEGGVVLEMADGTAEPEAAVYLDLWHGTCRAGRMATAADREAARYILRGSREAWQQVLAGKSQPIIAVMTGRLRLVRGDLVGLLPYAGAAKELLSTASVFETTFPDS